MTSEHRSEGRRARSDEPDDTPNAAPKPDHVTFPDPEIDNPDEPHCPVCGGAIDRTDVICPHCGESLVAG